MTERFARVCDECGKGTNVGYYADGPVYCTEACLNKHISPEEWDELYEEGGDEYYYTEWEKPAPDDTEATQGGAPTTAPCPYCGGSGEGSYWTHDLQETIQAGCHICEKEGTIPVDIRWVHALDAAGDDRREEYFSEHKWAKAKRTAICTEVLRAIVE